MARRHDHDAGLDLIVTPAEVIECTRAERTPAAIRWDRLTDDKVAAVPLLQRLAATRPDR